MSDRYYGIPTTHRPYPPPDTSWTMYQAWHDLLFAHWRVPVDALRARIPAGLTIDTFDGEAWLGVVPFRMSRIHPRRLPHVPWLSAFLELNVRTYVERDGRKGVWFFSLDAGNPLAVQIARTAFHLPYFNARMRLDDSTPSGGWITYNSARTHRGAPPAVLQVRYRPTGSEYHSETGTLESWLTERYCLYTADAPGDLYRGEIHHAPWTLQPAQAEFAVNTMAAAHGLELTPDEPLFHFARKLDVVVWNLVRI